MGHVVSSETIIVSTDEEFERLQGQMSSTSSFQGSCVHVRSSQLPSPAPPPSSSHHHHHKRSNRSVTNPRAESIDESTGEECPICTEDILLRDLAKLDPCNHEFHQECINQWLEDHSSCPNCRADVSQVVFNYKRCSLKKISRDPYDDLDDDDDDDDDEDDEDDESVITIDESIDSQVDTNSRRMTIDESEQTIILGGEEITSPDWDDLQPLTDSSDVNNVCELVFIKITEDKLMKLTFYFHTPELVIESTVASVTWQVTLDDEIIANVPANGRVIIRGVYYLKLFKLSIIMEENTVPFEDDKELNRLFYPSEESLIEMSQLQCNRHNRIMEFFQYLRHLFPEE